MKVCVICKTRLSIYNHDKRGLCHACIRIADKDIIKSPAADVDCKRMEDNLRRAARKAVYVDE